MSTKRVTNVTQRLSNTIAKNSPTILTGIAVTGLISTVILAVKATPKALEILEEAKEVPVNDGEKNKYLSVRLTKKEIIRLTWKCYIPAAVTGSLTIACIIGSNSINLRRNAALAGLYSISETALREYQAKVVETIGKKKEQTIKDEIAKDKIVKNPVNNNEIIITGKGESLCYDALSGRYFKSNVEDIRRTLNELSHRLMSENYISLNEVYYGLGLDGTKLGDMMGWHIDNVDDNLIKPHFSSQLSENGIPCLVLDFTIEPKHTNRY